MILFGKPVAEKIYQSLKIENRPNLAAILVGEDPASLLYTKAKEKKAKELGIGFKFYHFSGITSENEVLKLVEELGKNNRINGIIIQLPLPESFDTEKILQSVSSNKDIDGFFSENFTPPTVLAIMEILKYYHLELIGRKVVIVGYGRLVGKPLAKLLEKQGIKPFICTSNSDIVSETKDADVIISATGIPNLIKPEMVAEKAIVIDAGTAESKGKITGDLDSAVYEKASFYTPTPGGVGPVTVACLMRNLVEATKRG